MSAIFISHASENLTDAQRLQGSLHGEGLGSTFLDADKTSGLQPGSNWEQALYRALDSCEVVILVLTPAWLKSKWCFAEYVQARALGKSIIPVIFSPIGEALVAPEIQHLDLTSEREGGLTRLADTVRSIVQNSRSGFEWDRTRPPYPGLLSFEEADAAIFFGRDIETRQLIERLAIQRNRAQPRLTAILGASGAGKSSLLRAGVLPRLKRSPSSWMVLAPARGRSMQAESLSDLISATIGTASSGASRLSASEVVSLAQRHLSKDGRPEARIVVSIDQGEELFTSLPQRERDDLFNFLKGLLCERSPFSFLIAARSEFLAQLQSVEPLGGFMEEFSLRPLPRNRITDIVRGPARVAGLSVEDALVHRLAGEVTTEDALPLVAFALRELYDRGGKLNGLTADLYDKLGDTSDGASALEVAVRKAADDCIRASLPTPLELNALRAAFIPTLVRISNDNVTVRRQARWDELPAGSHRLIKNLIESRLLVSTDEGSGTMVEIAHEALLRRWPRLKQWIAEDRALLLWIDDVNRLRKAHSQVRRWERGRALLSGVQLDKARSFIEAHGDRMSSADRDYVERSMLEDYYRKLMIAACLMLVLPSLLADVADGYLALFFERVDWIGSLGLERLAGRFNLLSSIDLAITGLTSAVLVAASLRWGMKRWGAHAIPNQ